MKICLFFCTAIGCMGYYLTSKNQIWLTKPLAKHYRPLSYLLLIFCFLGWCMITPLSNAVFSWLASIILLLGLLPFIGLWRNKDNKHVKN